MIAVTALTRGRELKFYQPMQNQYQPMDRPHARARIEMIFSTGVAMTMFDRPHARARIEIVKCINLNGAALTALTRGRELKLT